MAYIDLQNLSTDAAFIARVTYAINKFSAYIQNEALATPQHTQRLNWTLKAAANLPAMVASLMPSILQDPNVVANLGAVSDQNLQTATETAAGLQIAAPVGYLDLIALASDATFLKRVQLAIAHFAAYVLGESPSTPGHASRYNWAKNAMMNTVALAMAVAPAVVLDVNVNPTLASTTDAALQAGVEAQIANLLL